MSGALAWRVAERKDRPALQAFTCTAPHPTYPGRFAPPHPKGWELEVQKYIHELKPSGATDRVILLGYHGAELAAVVLVIDEPAAPEFFHIGLLATSYPLRLAGAHFGDEAIEQALQWCGRRARGSVGRVLVSANVHPNNSASRACMRRNGFTRDAGRAGHYEQWLLDLEV